jgi:hypothetical protein
LNKAGMDIRNNPFGCLREGVVNRSKDARHHTNRATAPLASGTSQFRCTTDTARG